MGLPYQTEDYDEVGVGSGSVNDLGGMNFSTLNDNELMKRVDANNVGGSDLYTFASSAGNVDSNIIYSVVNSNTLGSIVLEEDNNTNDYVIDIRPNPNTNNSLRIKENGTEAKVGINVFDPQEALDIEGNLKLRSASIGLGATPTYGTTGQVLTSNGSGSAVSWSDNNVTTLGGMNFSTLEPNELMKKVDANNVGGSGLLASESIVGNVSTHTMITSVNPEILALVLSKVDKATNEYILQLKADATNGPNAGLVIKDNGGAESRVGINVADPEEALDIEGNIELRGGAGKIFFKHPSGLQKVELDGDQDGTNGGKFIVKTKVDGGSMTQKLEINNDGAIGLGATPNFGTAGNFLMSQGSGQAPVWYVPTTKIITSVKKTISQIFTSGGVTKITGWDTPHVDIGTTGWSNANSRYTIQRTGTYKIYLKAIVSNTGNTQASLRYLSVGFYIYNSGGGTPVFEDLDTTILFNVDSGGGRAERGSGDFSIIRTLNAGQYIEFQVVSLQPTGNYNVESGVFNVEEIGN